MRHGRSLARAYGLAGVPAALESGDRSPHNPAVRPQALSRGDKVAVLCPAGPIRDKDLLVKGMERLERLGLRPVLGRHALEEHHFLAGPDDARLADLQEAIDDRDTRGILCARGGYGTTRILARLDPSGLERDPRPVLGYSDITALHLFLRKSIQLVTLHGPMVVTSKELSMGSSMERLQNELLFGPPAGAPTDSTPPLPRADTPIPHVSHAANGTIEAPLVGGNLSLVASLCGTPWQLDGTGAMVFLEDVGEDPYRIDRMLTQLLDAGVLQGAAAVLFGDFHTTGTPATNEDPEVVRVLEERTAGLGIPVVHGLPFGHRPQSWTLPVGSKARLVADDPATVPSLQLSEPVLAV